MLPLVPVNSAAIATKSDNKAAFEVSRDATVRGPDVSFFSYSRIPKGAHPEGYSDVAPEVVFEIRSPDDR